MLDGEVKDGRQRVGRQDGQLYLVKSLQAVGQVALDFLGAAAFGYLLRQLKV